MKQERSQKKNGILKIFLSVLALSDRTLTVLENHAYQVDIPILKHIWRIFSGISARGMQPIIAAFALGAVYYFVRDRQKNRVVSICSALIAIMTVIGRSYMEQGSWSYIFPGFMQFVLALTVALGYYFVAKNFILFFILLIEKNKEWLLRNELKGKIEKFLFGKRVFLKVFIVIFVFGLPYLICFLPGTLQWDAVAQICQYFGVNPMTGQQPVAVTQLMGSCIDIGRFLFHSDASGMFLYTGSQFLIQCFVFAYVISLICKLNAPVLLRWGTLVLLGVVPIFPIWGYTLVKDTGYYIFILLFLTSLVDIMTGDAKPRRYKTALLMTASVGAVLFRNDGRYVIIITLIFGIFAYRKYRKILMAGLTACLAALIIVDGIYMPIHEIPGSPVKEMLSIPVQQTARYMRDYPDEITQDEREVLEAVFDRDLDSIAADYIGELSDPVKYWFVNYPSSSLLKEYFHVWFRQCLKHPDTYVQAFLNHTYGYFYPDRNNRKDFWDNWAIFYMGSSDYWPDDTLYISFVWKNSAGRDFLRETATFVYNMPVIGMLYSCGLWVYALLGLTIYMVVSGKRRELLVFVPGLCTLLICLVSPVNACFRYVLPIVVTFPINLLWCYMSYRKENCRKENRWTENAS